MIETLTRWPGSYAENHNWQVRLNVMLTETRNKAQKEIIAMDALDRIGEALKEKGLTLEELMESGREIRGKLLEKEYGLKGEE